MPETPQQKEGEEGRRGILPQRKTRGAWKGGKGGGQQPPSALGIATDLGPGEMLLRQDALPLLAILVRLLTLFRFNLDDWSMAMM